MIGRDKSKMIHISRVVSRFARVFSIFTIVTMGLVIASITNYPLAYSTSTINSTAITTNAFLDNIETKKVRVGDIDIAYKILAKVSLCSLSQVFR